MNWQSIETANKDGEILLYPHFMRGWWDYGAGTWMVANIPLNEDLTIADEFKPGRPFYEIAATAFGWPEPTHWQPLPEPPTP